jgi:phosphatidylserine/phosphatidylglycerophosphate/cardiolipin synthase-like enzyme
MASVNVRAYRGDRSVLLAFDLPEKDRHDLAGFAIRCVPPTGAPYWLRNRLSFDTVLTPASTAEDRVWTPSNEAPFQKFWWVDFPGGDPGKRTYQVTARYFGRGGALRDGASGGATLEVAPYKNPSGKLEIGFTSGYISSQAYADLFRNAPILPKTPRINFDTKPFERQYEWLGAHARRIVFHFIGEAVQDPSITLDAFAYDLNEPDFVRQLAGLGRRLRIVLDDSEGHQGEHSLEPAAWKILQKSAGKANLAFGHFRRFAHNKVLIQRKNGVPRKVLTGSANFSIRGLYVQANSVLVFNEPGVALLYGRVFDESFAALREKNGYSAFVESDVAKQWFDGRGGGLPPLAVSFAPHADPNISLERVAHAIANAKKSVLFAIMGLDGGGPVLEAVRTIARRRDVFSYGVTEGRRGLDLFKPNAPNSVGVPFGILRRFVPAPFRAEWGGGPGQHIHHKLVVIDFNGANPIAYMGSSNLAAGGEKSNGDNLIEIRDGEVAQLFGCEAIRLVDHYHFRASVNESSSQTPLRLAGDDAWTKPFFDAADVRYLTRRVFIDSA